VKRYASRRRKCIAAIVAFSVAASLAALGATAASARHRDNVTIRWMMFQTPNLPLSYWQDIVNRFEAKNPDIKVQLLHRRRSTATRMPSSCSRQDNSPTFCSRSRFRTTRSRGSCTRGRLLNRRRGAFFSPMRSAQWQAIQHSEQLTGDPARLLQQVDLRQASSEVPTTWAQFLAVCKKIRASGKTPIAIGGSQDTWASWIFLGGCSRRTCSGRTRAGL